MPSKFLFITLPPKKALFASQKQPEFHLSNASKRISSPLHYHSFTCWSGWPAVSLLQSSLCRQQNSALIKISWRWMTHIKTTSFMAAMTQQREVRGKGWCCFSSNSLRLLDGVRVTQNTTRKSRPPQPPRPQTSDLAYYCPDPSRRGCRFLSRHACLSTWLCLCVLRSTSLPRVSRIRDSESYKTCAVDWGMWVTETMCNHEGGG